MLSLWAVSVIGAAIEPIRWAELGLRPGIDLGFFTLRYYSLAYLIGIIFAYWHMSKMIKAPGAPLAQDHADDLFFYCTLGVILGGRLGYATFYQPELWSTPLEILKVWTGGMSFHGGLIGVLVAIAFVTRRGKLSFLRVCDYIAVSVPMGMLLGRLANFINGELWGRETTVSWGMIFPGGGEVVRHPSQLYQATFEGLVLLVILMLLFWQTRARWRPGLLVGVFTLGMGLARFGNEFFRQPDQQLADFAARTGLSMGQWLTIPMIAIGLFFIIRALRRPALGVAAPKAAEAQPTPAA